MGTFHNDEWVNHQEDIITVHMLSAKTERNEEILSREMIDQTEKKPKVRMLKI